MWGRQGWRKVQHWLDEAVVEAPPLIPEVTEVERLRLILDAASATTDDALASYLRDQPIGDELLDLRNILRQGSAR